MKKIDVIYNGWEESWVLGQLAESGPQLLFEYSADALQKKIEFSPVHLKLKSTAYSGFPTYQQNLPGLISDSLPDGWGLLLMDKLFKKQGLNLRDISPLDRLSYLSDRGIGALSFVPAKDQVFEKNDFTILKIASEVQKIINDKASEILPQLAQMGGSPQGARPKVLVQYNPKTKKITNDSLKNNLKNADIVLIAEPWLIKFPSHNEHIEACAIEALYMSLAKKCGLNVNTYEYFDLGPKLSAFGIQRFDRQKNIKILTHTLAGVLHADFKTPSSVDYVTFLRTVRVLTNDEQQVMTAFRQCVFNVVFNNRDDHPKNFSFLLNKKNQWQLSPVYDLTFSHGPNGEHHMDICGEGRAPGLSDLIHLSEQVSLNKNKVKNIINEVSEVANQFKKMALKWPLRKKTIDQINKAIQINLKALK